MLPITIVPVIAGLMANDAHAVRTGRLSGHSVAPVRALQLALVGVFGYSLAKGTPGRERIHELGLNMSHVVAKSLQTPDASRRFLDGSHRDLITLATVVVGHGVYWPGWRWSAHARPLTGNESEAHVGYVVSGRMIVRGPDGVEVEVGPGGAFEAPPGHDAWVVGDQPCVALDFGSRSGASA